MIIFNYICLIYKKIFKKSTMKEDLFFLFLFFISVPLKWDELNN
ncbi:hypothetical protein BACSTE_02670 [Bacteroides stercoris ATCC 43183]|uniref:Uncharacterized protein n=1 Tax=Bacteroides stercoris ATCC 43183 TaxID=449673 RepID=B0NT54_BACSE|nr:hypothetical protein BACSTE_02670 [Bacteroides stercoris ATCC 43183]